LRVGHQCGNTIPNGGCCADAPYRSANAEGIKGVWRSGLAGDVRFGCCGRERLTVPASWKTRSRLAPAEQLNARASYGQSRSYPRLPPLYRVACLAGRPLRACAAESYVVPTKLLPSLPQRTLSGRSYSAAAELRCMPWLYLRRASPSLRYGYG
jgi:hypothetical protein